MTRTERIEMARDARAIAMRLAAGMPIPASRHAAQEAVGAIARLAAVVEEPAGEKE